MPTCPDGHESASADFCDTCGMRIEGQPAAAAAAVAAAVAPATAAGGSPAGESCPQCGAGKTGMFCETCGFNYASGTPSVNVPPPDPLIQPGPGGSPFVGTASTTNVVGGGEPAPTGLDGAAGPAWSAVVTADRDYFDSVIAAGGPDATSIEFPAYCPERRFTLAGKEMRIGRRSASRGLDPEIDLTGPPTDPGISHLHAVLIAQPDDTWSVLDPGSSNGTQVNGADVVTGVPVPLHPGDRVAVGAWTVLTIQSA
jgi:hypothetical protein